MSESKLQTAFINWMRSACPEVTVWHVYNENSVNAIQGKMKKDRGVLAGVHDNHMIWAGKNYATLELKDPVKSKSANKYSDAQRGFSEAMDRAGFPHACCQNAEQIEDYIASLGLKPKWSFPKSLDATKRLMLQQDVMDAMYKR